jgi:hypothetical protein
MFLECDAPLLARQYHRQATERRQRLMNPPNAKPDYGIECRNGWPLPPPNKIEEPPPVIEAAPTVPENIPRDWLLCSSPREGKLPPKFYRAVIKACAEHYGVHPDDLISPSRIDSHVLPRHVAIYLIRQMTTKSTLEIGKIFRRDHTVAIYAVDKIEKLMLKTTEFNERVTYLRNELEQMILRWQTIEN